MAAGSGSPDLLRFNGSPTVYDATITGHADMAVLAPELAKFGGFNLPKSPLL
jgi:hypothetical protein